MTELVKLTVQLTIVMLFVICISAGYKI